MRPLTRLAPAKVNLGLYVLRKRPDGFHDVETGLYPIGWADTLEARPAPALSLTCSDPALPTDGGNLVVRAAEGLAEWAGIPPRAALHLVKSVPFGAGLGGGSSDAAATIHLLAELWGEAAPAPVLHALAARLGSDVPFFLTGRPAMARGRGDVLSPLLAADGGPYRCPFALCIAVAAVHVATGEAYGLVRPTAGERPDLAAAILSNDLDRWRREVTNDFEEPVAAAHPVIAEVRDILLREGAGWASMSGSGSAVVGAFEAATTARLAADMLTARGCRTWVERPAAGRPPG